MSGRYNPDNAPLLEQRILSGELSYGKDVVKYVKRAMCAVGEDYTKRTIEAGEAAKQHLKDSIRNISFEYQGSVMTNTHIRGASDIDLLVMCEKFYETDIYKVREEINKSHLHSPNEMARLLDYNRNFSPYQGNSNEDLRQLRMSIEKVMRENYSLCDTSKAKSVKITNQHLHRNVDVVTSSWFQSYDYVLSGMSSEKRGIKIYNKETGEAEGPDYPFLSISRINNRSAETNGRLKKMIRFLKNVRTDVGLNQTLSSFDINAICYSIPVSSYEDSDYKKLVTIIWGYMYDLWYYNKLNNLKSVVGDEYVFLNKQDKITAFISLKNEVFNIKQDLNNV